MNSNQTATRKPPLRLILIKPSKYDDDGYVMRYWRGVLPSNTLAALASLTQRAEANEEIGQGVSVELTLLDETAQKVEPRKIARRHGGDGARLAVGLVGVQTNQFPRAADIAREFVALGVPVMMGGFHVSGAIAMAPEMPPELQSLMDDGVILVKGEVEDAWGSILRDVYEGRPKLYYDITDLPDLDSAPIPLAGQDYMKKFAYPNMGTIDAGRGCPFSCSFCTIINVQGKTMRNRTGKMIAEHVRAHYPEGVNYYFFTDDNFSRNPNWEEIFDALIVLREDEGLDITFMMQVDTLAYRIKRFCAKAQRAGCSQVFIGLESIRDANLDAAGKRQNVATNYLDMVQGWKDQGITIHTGYIIGFPHDTPETVAEDVEFMKKDLGIDQASFFMLTPLPGSQDHARLAREGAWMDEDYNKFDSFHTVTHHPKMTSEQWYQAYLDAWDSFYDPEHMRDCLLRANERTYWGLFKNYIWYRNSVLDRTHPMIGGFYRLKDRTIRRPGFAIDGRWTHFKMRCRDISRTMSNWARLYFEMQELWLQTRPRRGRFGAQFEELKAGLALMRERAAGEASRLHEAAGEKLASIKESAHERFAHMQSGLGSSWRQMAEQSKSARSKMARLGDSMRFWSAKGVFSRSGLNEYWRTTYAKLRRGRIFAINPFSFGLNLLRDMKLSMSFFFHFFSTRMR